MTEKARRALREANRAGLFETFTPAVHGSRIENGKRVPLGQHKYADRLQFRALTKHTGWLQRIVYVRP